MPRVHKNYKVPIPYVMDSHVLLVLCLGQTVSRTKKIPYVEIQAILLEWNNEGTCKRKSVVRKLVPTAESLHDQMEGALEHPTKSALKFPHPVRTRPYCSVVHVGRQGKGKDS